MHFYFCNLSVADVGHKFDSNELELHHRESEDNAYSNDLENDVDAAESENDESGDIYENVAREKWIFINFAGIE